MVPQVSSFSLPFLLVCSLFTHPSGVGKTTFITAFLRQHRNITTATQPLLCIFCYRTLSIDAIEGVELKLHQGLPSVEDLLNVPREGRSLTVVFDDLYSNLMHLKKEDQEDYLNLITDKARKFEINCKWACTVWFGFDVLFLSVIFTIQNLFPSNPLMRVLFKNATALVIYNFPTDELAVRCLMGRLQSGQAKTLVQALHHSNSLERYSGYLFVDVHPHSKHSEFKFRNFIFPLGKQRQAADAVLSPDRLFVYTSTPPWLKL